MKAVKNKDTHTIEIPFEFITYVFPVDQPCSVSEALHAHIKQNFPLSFSYGDQLLKDSNLQEVKRYKTKSYFPTKEEAQELGNDFMKIHNVKPDATFGTPDALPASGKIDGDGVSWYGEGIEKDGI